MGSKGPSWADQWGGMDDDKDEADIPKKKDNKKMTEVKAAANAGFEKAKTAASVSAQKVKIGTSSGFKWIKDRIQKKSSSS